MGSLRSFSDGKFLLLAIRQCVITDLLVLGLLLIIVVFVLMIVTDNICFVQLLIISILLGDICIDNSLLLVPFSESSKY